MGVTGLWKLIEPCGTPVPVDTLEGKILAVDISIWLHQVVKGFQDNKGAALNNAHVLGLFHRLCKLIYYRVKPVFVFDGCVPQLKRDTIAKRQHQRNKITNEADRIQALLLKSLAKEKVVQMALGPNAGLLLTSPTKKKLNNKDDSVDDMFKLPDLPESTITDTSKDDEYFNESFEDSCSTENYASTSMTDSSFDESNPRDAYSANLQAIDVRSNEFKQLPADVRHDILVDIKETRKQSSWGRLHELPSQREEFSTFQMKRLIKRRQVQVSLEEAEKEMGNDHALTYSELTNIFTEEGILEAEALKKTTKQISSNENTRFLLVRDLKNKPSSNLKSKDVDEKSEEYENNVDLLKDEMPSSSKPCKKEEYESDADIQLAIALSLEDECQTVYNEKDYDYNSGEKLKLNRNQRKELQNATKGPAAAYMIEYAGMNKEELNDIMHNTQLNNSDFEEIDRIIGDHEDKGKSMPLKDGIYAKQTLSESQEITLRVSDDSETTDSDMEEVEQISPKPAISITLKMGNSPVLEDDLFADVFNEDECVVQETPDSTEHNAVKHDDCKSDDIKANKCESSEERLPDSITETLPKIENKIFEEYKSLNNNSKLLAILDDLRAQASEIKNIDLESIKLDSSVVEISDDEFLPSKSVKEETIEICDSDDGRCPSEATSAGHAQQSPRRSSKSPKAETPSKNHSITEFFNVNYVIKRTPDKQSSEQVDKTNKIQSPYFAKKSPLSVCKSGQSSPTSAKKISKASKSLFEQKNEVQPAANEALDVSTEAALLQESARKDEAIKEAAELLKLKTSTVELNNLAENLANERRDLEAERNRQDRMGMSITQRMNSDCQELLRLFGIPFIVAPMEAEAQCAFLDMAQLTNGTITDDSDIWLFGGRTVYKNFFAQNKHVMEFRSEQIEKIFNCDRNKLIQLACLVGSDYTTGINGIGAVTALEILASFTTKENNPESYNIPTIQNVLSTLQTFSCWWHNINIGASPPGSSARHALRKKLKNIEIVDGFPNIAVIEAYITPKVDDNKDSISWGYPDVESLREFAKKNFGWTSNKTDDILMPVLKKLNDKKIQQSIRNFFNVKNTTSSKQIKVSKRVKNAINTMMGNDDNGDDQESSKKVKKTRKLAKTALKRKIDETEGVTPNAKTNIQDTVCPAIEPGSSSQVARGPMNKTVRRTNIATAKEKIPQKEKSIEEMQAKKAHAAEILKRTSKEKKTKRKT